MRGGGEREERQRAWKKRGDRASEVQFLVIIIIIKLILLKIRVRNVKF
jgi:hypothetical protein